MSKILDAITHQIKSTQVMDADDGIFFARQLEHIQAKSADKKYADIIFRSVFPVSHECPEGAQTITVRSYDRVGIAKIISDYATSLPRADISGKEYSIPVKQLGNSYGYTTREIRAAKLTGLPLDARRSGAAMAGHEEAMNRIAWLGDADAGLIGLLTAAGIPTATVATKAATGTDWIGATPDEILYDLNNAVSTMRSTTLMKESPTRLLLPPAKENILRSTRVSVASDTSIMDWFLRANGYIKEIMPINELTGAGTGGVDVMVVYNPDPENLTVEIPMEPKQLPPQQKGLEWEIPVEAEFGGLLIRYPLSVAIWEGI